METAMETKSTNILEPGNFTSETISTDILHSAQRQRILTEKVYNSKNLEANTYQYSSD